MAEKLNGVYKTGLRWYDPSTGETATRKFPEDAPRSEIEFSRTYKKLLTKKRTVSIHNEHRAAPTPVFYFNGIGADVDGRIRFATGLKETFVISKNKEDFLFASTDQPFTSCFRLGFSDCHNGRDQFYNLSDLADAPGIYIAYIETQKREYEYKGVTYNHAVMSGRAFVYMRQDGLSALVGRPYGQNGFEVRDIVRRLLPNGLSECFYMRDEWMQRRLGGFQKDNFYNGIVVHDLLDQCFDKGHLYNRPYFMNKGFIK